jgi:tetratricopeptide (TPR) repeat protein
MKRYPLTLVALLCLLLVAPLSTTAAAAKDTWTSVRSKNFFLVGNASEKDIRRVATRLEQFRDVLSRLLKKASLASSTPTTVIVFKSESAYKQFAPQGTDGYFMPGQDMNYIALSGAENTDNPYNQNPFNVIFHEYVHLLVKNTLQNVPVWFNEGLAEYYSTLEILDGNQKVKIGKPIASHVLYLREQKLLPLRMLFEVDHRSPLYNESSKRGVFYAQSWALLHYLLLGDNAKRQPQFNAFLNLLMSNKSVDEAFQQAFQTDFATMEKELREYIRRDTYPAQIATFERKLEFDAEMQAAPLAEAEAQAYLGDLLLHMGKYEQAEKVLQAALKLDANLAIAESSLGMLYLQKQNDAEARRHLEHAVSLNSQNYLAHYYYAFVLSREGMSAGNFISNYPPETLRTMRAELKKTIELAPNYAEAYHLLAFVSLISGDNLDDAIGAISRAINLSPGEQEYRLTLAQLYLRKQDYALARRTLEAVMRNAEPEERERAQSLLKMMTANEELLARAQARADNPTDSDGDGDRTTTREAPTLGRRAGAASGGQSGVELTLPTGVPLSQPNPGEEQARGLLVRIDCSAKNIVLTVRVGDKLLKLQRAQLEQIQFVSFSADIGGDITCGARKPENPVIVTYRPTKTTNARAKFDGEVISVAFVSKAMLESK